MVWLLETVLHKRYCKASLRKAHGMFVCCNKVVIDCWESYQWLGMMFLDPLRTMLNYFHKLPRKRKQTCNYGLHGVIGHRNHPNWLSSSINVKSAVHQEEIHYKLIKFQHLENCSISLSEQEKSIIAKWELLKFQFYPDQSVLEVSAPQHGSVYLIDSKATLRNTSCLFIILSG